MSKSYVIGLDQDSGKPIAITCKRCGKTSYNLNDVIHRYCAHCHIWHDSEDEWLRATHDRPVLFERAELGDRKSEREQQFRLAIAGAYNRQEAAKQIVREIWPWLADDDIVSIAKILVQAFERA